MKADPVARRRFFDEHAATWNDSPNFRPEQERLRRLLAAGPFQAGQAVLDVGCGTGIALPVLREIVGGAGRVTGLDIAPAMVREARKIHADVLVGDAHALPFPAATFDGVLAFAFLPHLDDPGLFLREAGRVLRPGGHLLVLLFMSREICNDFHRKVGSAVEHDQLPPPEEFDRLAATAGLEPAAFAEAPDLFRWLARKPE